MIDWKTRAKTLAEDLVAHGAIRDPAWQAAFSLTPRHLFVPRFYALDRFNQPRHLVDGGDPTRRDEWLDVVYQDQVLVTHYQVIGTMLDGQETRLATSSASMPRVVATMLDRLAVTEGHRALEIGTGTGYNAALLAARLGDDNVTSIEVDSVAAGEATEHLLAAGRHPTLVVGDGTAGHPDRAPYDRIIVTCAIGKIPPAWIDQLTDDGVIVAPLTVGGALAVLRKSGPGEVAGGLDHEQAYFMPLHGLGQPAPDGFIVDMPQLDAGRVYRTTTDIEPAMWANQDFKLWLALHLPEARVADTTDEQGNRIGVTVYTATSRASADYRATEDGAWSVVHDAGRLWNTVEAACSSWRRNRQPDRTRIGIAANTSGEQYAWLDRDDGPIQFPLSPG